MSDDKRDNVIPLGKRAETRTFVEPGDIDDLIGYAHSESRGHLSLTICAPPDGVPAWLLSSPNEVERLGVLLIQFAARMRGQKGPP